MMDALQAWFKAQFAEKKVEPNSWLGRVISFLDFARHPPDT